MRAGSNAGFGDTLADAVRARLGAALGRDPGRLVARPVGGGCISRAFAVEAPDGLWFVKVNRAEVLPMFEAEADGLCALAAPGFVRVPEPVCTGRSDSVAFLVLEHIDLRPSGRAADAALGERLAHIHGVIAAEFGWHRDNTIGSTPQRNDRTTDWVEFFRDRRLGDQLARAASGRCPRRLLARGERLCAALGGLLAGHRPVPSLVHGDLWGGNHAVDDRGAPVIFDPAVYHGDRETDLAMSELFAGFGPDFLAAYRAAWPLDPGYAVRRDIYNLYHVLNHVNLFGGGYVAQAEDLVDRLLAEAG